MWHPRNEFCTSEMSCARKKYCLPFVSKYFGAVLWEACSLLHNEKERSLTPCSAPRWWSWFGLSALVTLCVLCRVPLHLRGTQAMHSFKEPEQCLITFPAMFSCLIISKILCTFWLIPTEPWAIVSIALFKASPKSLPWMLIANLQLITVEVVINAVFSQWSLSCIS